MEQESYLTIEARIIRARRNALQALECGDLFGAATYQDEVLALKIQQLAERRVEFKQNVKRTFAHYE